MRHKPGSQSGHCNRTAPRHISSHEPRALARASSSSFPRRRESSFSSTCLANQIDSRLRGNDKGSIVQPRSEKRHCCGTLRRPRNHAYILLETVVATGLLVVGLGVIGAQIQGAVDGVRKMERRTQAMTLAEMKLAELDLGLVELESFDEVEENDFGPRYPDWGWRLITEETGLEEMFSLTLEVLYVKHDEDGYKEDSFDHDTADMVYALHALRSGPRALDLGIDFGLDEERFDEVSAQLDDLGIDGLDAASLDPSILAKLDIKDFLEVLPILADVMGIDVSDMLAGLPPELQLLLDGLSDGSNAPDAQGNGDDREQGEQPNP